MRFPLPHADGTPAPSPTPTDPDAARRLRGRVETESIPPGGG